MLLPISNETFIFLGYLFFCLYVKPYPLILVPVYQKGFVIFFKKTLFILLLLVNVCVYDVVSNHIYKEKKKKN